ncbi:NAD(P)-binding protein [Hypoxylon rubiginosum]|uniref:NAD(P)-binding protein n=1 Tax=Hypoxylon rubiginosum TaxID=110542 RepID=A0ACC0D723_9PEZI|nr:NAD(P)-binding protein [Hypoxylon rubiginosum]
MSLNKRKVLITGCSDDSIGSSLALAFHKAGYHVYATARDPNKITQLMSQGIETLTLDTLSEDSIAECVKKVPSLDILVNNAGKHFLMPVVDVNIAEAKKVYDTNVWAHIAVTQAFMPLLLESKGTIVNQTSVGVTLTLPFQGVYNSSKAAMSMLSDTMRLELEPFGVKVIELRTGVVKTNLIKTMRTSTNPTIPEDSIYEPARESIEKSLRQEQFENAGMEREQWAEAVVQDLSRKSPRPVIWRGEAAFLSWVLSLLPFGWSDGIAKKFSGLNDVAQILGKKKQL